MPHSFFYSDVDLEELLLLSHTNFKINKILSLECCCVSLNKPSCSVGFDLETQNRTFSGSEARHKYDLCAKLGKK